MREDISEAPTAERRELGEDVMELIKRADPGTHVKIFRTFYDSNTLCLQKEYDSTANAIRAQTSMCNYVNRNKIYDVRIARHKNVLKLIKPSAYQQTQDYRDQIMRRFLRKE